MKSNGTVLVVDDESGFRENVAERFTARGYRVLEAGEAGAALKQCREQYVDVAVVDIHMPGMDGITLMEHLKDLDPQIEVVIVTGRGSIESAVEAMRRGAHHYVSKPVRLGELEMAVRRAMEKAVLARQNQAFREQQRRSSRARPDIIAHSPAMLEILDQAEQVAQTDYTVLIEGETGTGKEVIAEFIHRKSQRKEQTFSVINCGALSETLLDAELFGYEKGAFTGANEARPGIFEVTDGGTLLLDEIGEISAGAQVRLLRVLERGLFRRVGATRERTVNVRVMAATLRDLEKEVEEGRFREDLYHRLLVFRIHIPALRERPEDIVPLAEHFLARVTPPGHEPKSLSPEAAKALLAYPWPGNVRELAHAMERAAFAAQLAGSDEVRPNHFGLSSESESAGDLISLEAAQKRHVKRVLERVGGNRQKAASVLGITERHLYRLLKQYKTEDDGQAPPP